MEATYGWYWAVDVVTEAGANLHLAHPLGVKAFEYRRVKKDEIDAKDLADLLRMGRLPEAWIAPPVLRELRELVRYRAKLVALRSHCKAEIHAVLAKCGVQVSMTDLFGLAGTDLPHPNTPRRTPPPYELPRRQQHAPTGASASSRRARTAGRDDRKKGQSALDTPRPFRDDLR